jgi:hypothetical protein
LAGILRTGADGLGGTDPAFPRDKGEADVAWETMLAVSSWGSGERVIRLSSGICSLAREAWSIGI